MLRSLYSQFHFRLANSFVSCALLLLATVGSISLPASLAVAYDDCGWRPNLNGVGVVKTWGYNFYDGNDWTPPPSALCGCKAVASSSASAWGAAIQTNGDVFYWGAGSDGSTRPLPPTWQGGWLGSCTQVAVGFDHLVFLESDGTVKTLFLSNTTDNPRWCGTPEEAHGYICPNDNPDRTWEYHTNTIESNTYKYVAAGNQYTLAIRASDGRVFAWGLNSMSRCGTSAEEIDDPERGQPYWRKDALGACKQVAASGWYSAALRENGTVAVWGGDSGIDDDIGLLNVPSILTNPYADHLCCQIALGQYHMLALLDDGTIVTWGYDCHYGEYDNGRCSAGDDDEICTSEEGKYWVLSGLNAVAVAAGAAHSVALLANGRVISWGLNDPIDNLPCGDTAYDSNFWTQSGLLPCMQIAASSLGTMAIQLANVADLDGSGEVDSADLGLFMLDMGINCPGCPSDLDGSGWVDSADLGILLLSYGPDFDCSYIDACTPEE
jgi:hypothetical protein